LRDIGVSEGVLEEKELSPGGGKKVPPPGKKRRAGETNISITRRKEGKRKKKNRKRAQNDTFMEKKKRVKKRKRFGEWGKKKRALVRSPKVSVLKKRGRNVFKAPKRKGCGECPVRRMKIGVRRSGNVVLVGTTSGEGAKTNPNQK